MYTVTPGCRCGTLSKNMLLKPAQHRPVLSVGEVAGALVHLQGALARTLALILFHPVIKTKCDNQCHRPL